MTKLLEQAFEKARKLSPAMQDEIANAVLALIAEARPTLQLSAEEEATLEESLAQAERGEFATDEEVRVIWVKHGL